LAPFFHASGKVVRELYLGRRIHMKAFKPCGWVVVGAVLGVCLVAFGCGKSDGQTVQEEADALVKNTVEGVDDEAMELGHQERFCGGAPNDQALGEIGKCVDAAKTCKQECVKNNNLDAFKVAVQKCKDDFIACRTVNPDAPSQCFEAGKVCVKAAIETIKPLVDCMKKCFGDFKTCVEAIPPAQQQIGQDDQGEQEDQVGQDDQGEQEDQDGENGECQQEDQDQQDQNGPGIQIDGLRQCFVDRHVCEEKCMPEEENAAVEACEEAIHKCFEAGADPATCKADFLKCRDAALANPPAQQNIPACLTACGDKFKECVTAIKP
jgi:hypothetical protein